MARLFVAMSAFVHALCSPLGRGVFANVRPAVHSTSPWLCASFAADRSFQTKYDHGIGLAAAAIAIAGGHHRESAQCSGSPTAASSDQVENAANLLLLARGERTRVASLPAARERYIARHDEVAEGIIGAASRALVAFGAPDLTAETVPADIL